MIRELDLSIVPDKPGCYVFLDGSGQPIYVGKAKSLRHRLASYFQGRQLDTKTVQMLEEAESLEWTVASNEVEAVLLEYNFIQEHRPRFNVRLRDDKSFPYLVLTASDPWPRVFIGRGKPRRGWRYFGPFAHAHALRETLDLLRRVYPIRTCTDLIFREHQMLGRPCLYYDIQQCPGPCVGAVSKDDYDEIVKRFCRAIEGVDPSLLEELEHKMWEAASREEFEKAALYRNRLGALSTVAERQRVLSAKSADFDAIGVALDDLQARVDVFRVRGGALRARYGYFTEAPAGVSVAELLSQVIPVLYGNAAGTPKRGSAGRAGSNDGRQETGQRRSKAATGASSGTDGREVVRLPEEIPPVLLVQEVPVDKEALERFLSEKRGAKVSVRPAKAKDRRQLLELVVQNATEALERAKLKRAADHNARSRALLELAKALELEEAPLRIECFDVSNTGPSEVVGSMVVFEEALPKKSDYRRFKVKTVEGQDDFASMKEIVARRARRLGEERQTKGFRYEPGLILIDGGPGQLAAALDALEEAGEDHIPVASLAKRLEEVYLPGRKEPVVLPRDSEALYLLQRVRDEAHRFAVTFHRKLRERSSFRSSLDEVEGLGPLRKKRLLQAYASLQELANATADEVARNAGLPRAVALRVVQAARKCVTEQDGGR